MKFKEFAEVVSELYNLNKDSEKYLKTVPSDINMVLIDNKYQSNTNKAVDVLFKAYFGDIWCDVSWFLYDCTNGIKAQKKDGVKSNLVIEGREYWIHDLKSFLEYSKIELFTTTI